MNPFHQEGYGVGEKLEVTIWNDKGEIVVHEFYDAPTATPEEIEEAIFLIENGCPAHTAMFLAKQHQPLGEIVDDPPMSGVEKSTL